MTAQGIKKTNAIQMEAVAAALGQVKRKGKGHVATGH